MGKWENQTYLVSVLDGILRGIREPHGGLGDPHFHKQMSFLRGFRPDYIGRLENMEREVQFIFGVSSAPKVKLSGPRKQVTQLLRIDPANIPEEVMPKICNVYSV